MRAVESVAIQRRGFGERFDLCGYLETVVRLAAIAAAAAAVAVAAVLLVVAPEAAAVAAVAAAAAVGIGCSFAPYGIVPIQKPGSKELHRPYQQI